MLVDITILVAAILTNIAIAILVYLRNSKSVTHRLFVALGITLSAWSMFNYLSIRIQSNEIATLMVRLVMFFSVPIGILFLLLVQSYPSPVIKISRQRFWATLGIMAVTMGFAVSPLVFPEVIFSEGHSPKPIPGIGMILYVPVVIGGISYGLFLLIKKLVRSQGMLKIQTAYLLGGVSVMFALIISLNFIAVNVFDTSIFIPYAPLFTLPFTLLTAYSIIRHRLLDIQGALFRSLSLTILVGAVLGIYGLLLVFAVPLIAQYTGFSADILAGASALISIPIARFVQRGLTKLTDRFLFQNRADYRAALVDLGQKLSRTINIEEVNSIILDSVREIVRTKKSAILLRNPETKIFEPRGQQGMGSFNVSVKPDNPLLKYFKENPGVASKDEIALVKEQIKNESRLNELDLVEGVMHWLDVAVIIPLFVNRELSGLIVIGEKLSGTPYLQDDLEFLQGFASQAAVALENARLYQESLEFGQRLQEEVERATEELETANIQLKNLDKAKSEFLSIASHQLYTPLTALRGYVSMMQEGDFGEVPENQKEILDILDKSADRLIDLIKGLLDISRIEQGRLELNLESIDLSEIAKELVQDLMPNARAKGLEINFHPSTEEVPHVVIDRERVRQVMLNFIDNSIKYTPTGHIDVRVAAEGDQIRFSVEDTGKGISKEDVARLFHKFTRVGGSARFHTEGTGLGLYVAKQIVKEHRGELDAESPGEGKGSTFSMYLPAEGTPNSLKPGEKASVEIKAAEAQQTPAQARA